VCSLRFLPDLIPVYSLKKKEEVISTIFLEQLHVLWKNYNSKPNKNHSNVVFSDRRKNEA